MTVRRPCSPRVALTSLATVALLVAPGGTRSADGHTPDDGVDRTKAPIPASPAGDAVSSDGHSGSDGAVDETLAAPEGVAPHTDIARACGEGWQGGTLTTPEGLEGFVHLWEQVFGVYGTGHVVQYDIEHPQVIWSVVELPREADGQVDKSRARRATHAENRALRQRLRRLERNPTPRDAEDERLLAVASAQPHNALAGASRRLRSQRGVADRFCDGLQRAVELLPSICDALQREGVPTDLAALPFVESMFNPEARSHVGALGLWQLMPLTARELGLRVGRRHDDRLDIEAATSAAARLLRQNERRLGNWPLAVTAYNHGPAGVRRGVDKTGSKDLADLVRRYDGPGWGFDSKNFFVELIAARNVATRSVQQSTCPANATPLPDGLLATR